MPRNSGFSAFLVIIQVGRTRQIFWKGRLNWGVLIEKKMTKETISTKQKGLIVSLFVIISGCYLIYSALHDIDLTYNALIMGYYYTNTDTGSNLKGEIKERSYSEMFIEGMRTVQIAMLTILLGGISFGYFLKNV